MMHRESVVTNTGMLGAELTVGQVAAAAGVASSAIRFYDEHGLIASRRNAGNQRRFGRDAACRVRVIRVCQRIGMSVAEIRTQLASVPEDALPDDWTELGARLEANVLERIAALHAVLSDLASEEWLCELPSIADVGGARRPGPAAEGSPDHSTKAYHTV